ECASPLRKRRIRADSSPCRANPSTRRRVWATNEVNGRPRRWRAYRALERRIRTTDEDALRARWEFGRRLLAEREANGGGGRRELRRGRYPAPLRAVPRARHAAHARPRPDRRAVARARGAVVRPRGRRTAEQLRIAADRAR